MLEYIITSKAKRNVLKLILSNPDTHFYTREIARLTGEPLNAVRRELGYLEKAGLIRSYKKVNLKYHEVIKEFPIFKELTGIINTTLGIGGSLRNKFRDMESIDIAFIYGSLDKVEKNEEKYVNLFVTGSIRKEEFHQLALSLEKEVGKEINYTLMTKREFVERNKMGEPYLRKITREEKVMLKGQIGPIS